LQRIRLVIILLVSFHLILVHLLLYACHVSCGSVGSLDSELRIKLCLVSLDLGCFQVSLLLIHLSVDSVVSSGLVQVIVAFCLLELLLRLLFLTELSMKIGVVISLKSLLEVDGMISSLVEGSHSVFLHRLLIVLDLHCLVALWASNLILIVRVCVVVGLVTCLHSRQLHLVPVTNGANCCRTG